jgi:UDP-GlcNAc:undecaprenyl-phosphate GlcNAc-1-phosphate transferase
MLASALLALLAALGVGVLAPTMRRIGFAVGAVDRPGHRKVHATDVSRLGGVAVWGAVGCAVWIAAATGVLDGATFTSVRVTWPLLATGAGLLVLVGVVDDVRGLRARTKLLAQGVAAVLVASAGCVIREATNPITGASIDLGVFAVPVTLAWVIGVTNALNLIDGLDGLAAGVGLIVAGTLALISFTTGRPDVALLAGILAGALVGFLYFNFNPATIFLGDSGSLFLGYALAVLSLESAHKGATAVLVMAPILALGVPLMDTTLTVLRRLVSSGSLMQPDRDHIHHRLIALGLSHRRAVLVLYVACLLGNVAAVFSVRAATRDTALVAVAVALATFLGVRKLRYHELPLPAAFVGPHALLALADAVCLVAAYAVAVMALHGGTIPANAGIDVLRAATVAGVLELCVLLLNDAYREDSSARRRWTTLAVSLVLGAVAASIGLFATHATAHLDVATFALNVMLAAALLALMRGAAMVRRRLMRRRAAALGNVIATGDVAITTGELTLDAGELTLDASKLTLDDDALAPRRDVA